MNIRFPDSNEIARIFGVCRRDYHRYIKTYIVSDFRQELNELNINNPDIGIDDNRYLYLSDSNHEIIISTNLTIEDYKD